MRTSSMKTAFANISHGNEPYILTASIAKELGVEIIIPSFYGDRQRKILKRLFGEDRRIFLDSGSAEILEPVVFKGDYEEYVREVVDSCQAVERELREYLRDFESTSLTDEKRRFKKPKIELNAGSAVSIEAHRSFYAYPGLLSEYARYCPYEVEAIDEFIAINERKEKGRDINFIPYVNSLSYLPDYTEELKNRLPSVAFTPPLKKKTTHDADVQKSIYVMISGTGSRAEDVVKAAKRVNLEVYCPAEEDLPFKKAHPDIIFNKNVIAVLHRGGWGTLWNCQVSETPSIIPEYKRPDDPEIYHNCRTVERLGLGVVYEEFDESVLLEALSKAPCIRKINEDVEKIFGTLDGLDFVAEKIEGLIKSAEKI